jgi:5,10-methylenetetrahydromethanopterin reductase
MPRYGYGFLGTPSLREMTELAKRAEASGFDSLWVSETRFKRDAISSLAAIATSTSTATLASAAVNVYTRNPVLLAVSFAALDEISNGRMILGIAPGSPSILEKQGIRFTAPLKRLQEYVQAFRLLMQGSEVNYRGEFVKIDGASLDFTPVRKEIPVYIAASGPSALRLAGKIANGVILDIFTSAEHAEFAIQRIKEGAESVGRKMDEIEIAALNMISVQMDSEAAKNSLKPLLASYLATFPSIAEANGISKQVLEPIKLAFLERGEESAAKLLTNSIVNHVGVVGDPDECLDRLRDYQMAGVTIPILIPVNGGPEIVASTVHRL